MANVHRRDFLRVSTIAAAAAATGPFIAPSRASANDRIRVGVVGVNARGAGHMYAVNRLADKNLEVAAICDCHEGIAQERAAQFEEQYGKKVRTHIDMREMFDDPEIDAVTIATPNHWHALATIWACQAGKDVYCEKPASHTILEGRQIVDAARKHNRIVLHGTQCRSNDNIREAVRLLQDGVIGDIYMARAIAFKCRESMGPVMEEPAPAGMNWDLFCGPGPLKPYAHIRWFHWSYCWDTGDGAIGNQGVHQLDLIRWALKLDKHPNHAQSMGGTFVHDEFRETPNAQVSAWQWDGRKVFVQYEVRQWYTPTEAGMGDQWPFIDGESTVGVTFFGSDGYLVMPDYASYHVFLGRERKPGPAKSDPKAGMADLPHIANFFDAVRSRKIEDLNSDIEEGHRTCVLFHLANIAYRTGHTVQFDPETEKFIDDVEANKLASYEYRKPYVIGDA